MRQIIGNYLVEYKCGWDYCEVRKIGYVDEFGRLRDCELVYSDKSWKACVKWAKIMMLDEQKVC